MTSYPISYTDMNKLNSLDIISQAVGYRSRGKEDIDIHLLKPARFMPDPDYVIPPDLSDNVVQEDCFAPGQDYITYPYRTAHPVLQWLPTKLAEWIGSNLGDEMNIPAKQGDLWTAAELNAIITGNLVGGPYGHLHTFGCIQWECEVFNGRPKARCYPFDMDGHRFRNKNPKVQTLLITSSGKISCMILYPISYPILLNVTLIVLSGTYRTVCVSWPPIHSGWTHSMNSM